MANEPNTPDQQSPDEPIRGSEALYQMAVWSVILIGPTVAALLMLVIGGLFGLIGLTVTTSWLILWLAYIATSFHIVQENEVGGIFVLQNPAREVDSGLRFAPRWITELNKLPISSQQDEFPDNPENVAEWDDSGRLPPGKKAPLEVTTAGIDPKDATLNTDPLERRQTLKLQVVVVWRLAKGRFFDMWNRLPPAKGSGSRFDQVRQQMYDSVDVQATEKVSGVTPAELLKRFAEINTDIESELQNDLARWGVKIERAHLKSPRFPREVNTALDGIVAATAKAQGTVLSAEAAKQATKLEAEGQRYRIEQIAEGNKTAEKLLGEGQRLAADALNVSGEQYFTGHVLKETVGEGSVIITGDSGLTGLLALGEALKKKDGDK